MLRSTVATGGAETVADKIHYVTYTVSTDRGPDPCPELARPAEHQVGLHPDPAAQVEQRRALRLDVEPARELAAQACLNAMLSMQQTDAAELTYHDVENGDGDVYVAVHTRNADDAERATGKLRTTEALTFQQFGADEERAQ